MNVINAASGARLRNGLISPPTGCVVIHGD
jgi:hypothetical protein